MEKFDSMISSVTDSRLGQRSNRKTSSKKNGKTFGVYKNIL